MEKQTIKVSLNEQYVGREECTIDDITSNVVVLLRCRRKSRVAEDYAVANIEPDESPRPTVDVIEALVEQYLKVLEENCDVEGEQHNLEAFVVGGNYVMNVFDTVSNGAYFRTFRGGDSDVETALDKMGVEVKRFPHRQDEMARKKLVVRAEGKYEFDQRFDEGNERRAPMSEETFRMRQRQGIY